MDAEQIVADVAEQVRELVRHAEQRAAAIVAEAEEEARRIREQAESEARERLAAVRAALDELQGRLGAEVDPGPATVPEPEPPPVPEPAPDPVPDPVPGPEPVPEPGPEPAPEPSPPPDEGTPPSAANGTRSPDAVAARLVAMNMALAGSARQEIDAKLAAEFELEDREALIDEVLARAGG